ncbi:MAG TPA: UDP-N-acetylglucosamine 2-epimerase (non-hydrolyzing) [Candidatus Brocadiia bacterium]|nr:UDP-N-acetylglucosamine 2-epimerase (non-hydrolyzing) [Candidatus Brocadiia bacterium]
MKWLSVVGARPQFVKVAAVCRAVAEFNLSHGTAGRSASEPVIEHKLLHTGQHYDRNMSGAFFEQLGLPEPDFSLNVGSASRCVQVAAMIAGIAPVIEGERPDVVIVYGDTNSTLAGALAASNSGCILAHVEAGLRSGNRRMAEEINRIVADHVSGLLFCPTHNAVENLKREGIDRGVHFTGDVMLDALLRSVEMIAGETMDRILIEFGLVRDGYCLATIHRAENTDDPARLTAIMRALDLLGARLPVVLPLHPRTRRKADEYGIPALGRVRIIEPVPYFEMLALEKNAALIVTDSGGVQREAFFLGVPGVIVRDETEWPEIVEQGMGRLSGVETAKILSAADALLSGPRARPDPAAFGGGHAAGKIVSILAGASN